MSMAPFTSSIYTPFGGGGGEGAIITPFQSSECDTHRVEGGVLPPRGLGRSRSWDDVWTAHVNIKSWNFQLFTFTWAVHTSSVILFTHVKPVYTHACTHVKITQQWKTAFRVLFARVSWRRKSASKAIRREEWGEEKWACAKAVEFWIPPLARSSLNCQGIKYLTNTSEAKCKQTR